MKRLLNAFRFMTIIPIPGPDHADLTEAGKSAAFFPVVGFVLGLLLWAAALFCGVIWSPAVSAVIVTALWVVLTAGLHLDGLADLADGLGGGWDADSRLKIMKDSAIGTYGAIAVGIVLMMKSVFIFELANESAGFSLMHAALIFVPIGGRYVQVMSIRIFKSAKKEGYGIIFKSGVTGIDAVIVSVITLAAATAFWGFTGVIIIAAAVVFMLTAGVWISRRLGGLNGDSYGAICELGELFILILISLLTPGFSGWLFPLIGKVFNV